MNGWYLLLCCIAGGAVGMFVLRRYPSVGLLLGGFITFIILIVSGAWNGS